MALASASTSGSPIVAPEDGAAAPGTSAGRTGWLAAAGAGPKTAAAGAGTDSVESGTASEGAAFGSACACPGAAGSGVTVVTGAVA
eukprot:10021469-Alexandrium_andersonii.AAC.1